MERTPPVLRTARLLLRMATAGDAAALLDFHTRNRDHLAEYEPRRAPDFLTLKQFQERIARGESMFRDDRGLPLVLFNPPDAHRIIGTVSFSEIIRGPLQACFLGYSLDAAEQGQGLISEAVTAAVKYAFDTLNLHRVIAGYVPTNVRSGRVLRRLGFVVEGYQRDYLLINGVWQDHVMTALINPNWTEPP